MQAIVEYIYAFLPSLLIAYVSALTRILVYVLPRIIGTTSSSVPKQKVDTFRTSIFIYLISLQDDGNPFVKGSLRPSVTGRMSGLTTY